MLNDNQLKVCYNCMSDSHVIKDCPNIKCHFCKENGHYEKHCPKTFLCDKCGLKEDECECKFNSEDYNDRDTDSDTADCEMQADNAGEAGEEKVEKQCEPTINTQVKKITKVKRNRRAKTTENSAKNTTARTVNKDADNNETDNSRQRKSTRRTRLAKCPSDEELWSLVEKRKQKKRQAARMKDVSECKGMDECEEVNIDKL